MDEPTSYEYVEPVNPSLECAICRTAFVSPAMSPVCQHIFCHLCVARAIELSPTCPIDRSPLRLEDLIEAPRIVKAMVEELAVFCPNASRGCRVQCERGLLEGHLRDECASRPREDSKGKGKAVADEPAEDAEKRDEWLRCELCQAKLRESDLKAHSTSCPTAIIACPHCDTAVTRSALPSHNIICQAIPVPCPHAHHGCPARLPRSAMAEEHLEAMCPYEPVKEYLDKQEARLVEVESENKMLSLRCAGLEAGMKEMRTMLDGLRRGLGGFYVEVDSTSVIGVSADLQERPTGHRAEGWPGEIASDFAPPPPARPRAAQETQLHLSPRSGGATLHDPHPLSTSPTEQFPFPSLHSPSAAAVSPTNPLSTVLASLQDSIVSLSASISSLEARQSSTLMNETLRLQDDVQSVRAVVHGMRMQMHYLMMEVGRLTGSAGGGLRSGGVGAGGHPSSSADSVESTSDDEQGHPPLMGMGGPTLYGQPQPHQRYFLPSGASSMGQRMGGGAGPGPLMYPMGGMKL